MKEKVIVGLSGGVDSSVAALLLLEKGYDVHGVTMHHFDGMDDIERDAKAVADTLGISHQVVDFRKEFKKEVMDAFVADYLAGRTPNPCVVCNRRIKWETLLSYANTQGAAKIATGHYARIQRLPNGRLAVTNSVTASKDQTYALYQLTQQQLENTLMPVGDYPKDEVRRIAEAAGLPVAHKRDSQEICFIPDHDYAAFIQRQVQGGLPGGSTDAADGPSGLPAACRPGRFVTPDGRVLGEHKGIIHYTIGQRKGLNLAMGHPVFVTDIRPETNEVVIGENEDLFTRKLYCRQLNFMAEEGLSGTKELMGKIRYAHKGGLCRIHMAGEDLLECEFEEPVRAVTCGQSAVFYEDGHIYGGGVIVRG